MIRRVHGLGFYFPSFVPMYLHITSGFLKEQNVVVMEVLNSELYLSVSRLDFGVEDLEGFDLVGN